MLEIFTQPEAWIALLTLTFLEIVLGIDNIIFISMVSGKLPKEQQPKARMVGLSLALIMRLILLSMISYITQLTQPITELFGYAITWRDLILFVGGLFLIAKSTKELHHKVTDVEHEVTAKAYNSFAKAIFQIIVLDLIFSFDSILTAIGLTDQLILMIIAVIISIIIMMVFAGKISDFINKYPTLQVLALSFLILIGFTLILEVEALGIHIPKGYIYFAVFFSLAVETININATKKRKKNEASA
ncbi:TerC family protein [Luteibaculum oceani]|uniref:TerC family protein n=1 Tax=Luteibaculum oceani TaxID=1294296 RepID=A0A5C6V9G4_9FLAO|nr:TerC family protein [Luteibaculum oceani]TXC82123.1 TerC family protein [Luteibaculum oceani]